MAFEIRMQDVAGLVNNLKALRNARNLTLEQLAEKINATHGTISRLESGDMRMTDEYLEKLAAALGCHPAEIITDASGLALSDGEREAIRIARASALQAWLAAGEHMTDNE